MGGGPKSQTPQVNTVLEEALARGKQQADPKEVAAADSRLEELLQKVGDPIVADPVVESQAAGVGSAVLAGVAMRTAVVVRVKGRVVALRCRGVEGEVDAELAPGVAREVVAQAAKNGDAVVVECAPDGPPLVVGVLQTRVPRELKIKAQKIHIEGEQEVLLRSGRGAMRVRSDGDVELVGSRISAMSRGLFRLVGRVLRLN